MVVDVMVASADSPLDVRLLAGWLAESPELNRAEIAVVGPASGESMGAVDEVVRVLLEPGGVAVALASAIGAWAATRAARTRIRVRVGEKQVEVEVEAPGSRKAQEIAESVLRGLDQR